MKNFAAILLAFISISSIHAQKKIIDHTTYAEWNSLTEFKISNSGTSLAYVYKPYEGNSKLVVLKNNDVFDTLFSIERASKFKFHHANNFAVATLQADYFQNRKLKIAETKKEKMPKDSLLILNLQDGSKQLLENVEKFDLLDSLSLVIGQFTHDFKYKNKGLSKSNEKVIKDGYSDDEKTFFVYDLSKGMVFQKQGIVDYFIDEEQQFVVFVESGEKKGKSFQQLHSINLKSLEVTSSKEKFDEVLSVYTSSKAQTHFLIAKAFDDKKKKEDLYLFDAELKTFNKTILAKELDSNFTIKKDTDFEKIGSGQNWMFQVQRKEPKKEKDSLLDEEKVKLDVWSWKDDQLQPEQLLRAKSHYKKGYKVILDVEKDTWSKLEDDTLRISYSWKNEPIVVAKSSSKYVKNKVFQYPWREDLYQLNVLTGEKNLLLAGNYSDYLLTPDGEFLYYLNESDSSLYGKRLADGSTKNLTESITEDFLENLNGMYFSPGFAGDLSLDANKKDLWFNTKKGVFKVDANSFEVKRITPIEWINADVEVTYSLIVSDSEFVNTSNVIIDLFDKNEKLNYYYTLTENLQLEDVMNGYFQASNFKKSSEKQFFARVQNNELYPNIYEIKNHDKKQVSDLNPQQKEYNWSKVEPVKWTAYDGKELNGLLYRPEDYDSTKKYPLLVYYYETSSEDLHQHSTPRPTASIIFPTEYASSGYFVFMPDIDYQIGYPAKGAYNSIMSGTDHVLKLYPAIDSTRMGLQGQSWGGYQTAQLITMTQRYSAAMAGAPVANMFSAYGGIRWGSGLSRQFQYEHSQSRIGKTIWEAPELYIENSPLFGLNKVKTPLLIMHNDEDGAVPWYQGIELFMGLRRLDQPVWLLNYNGDDHNLMKKGNRKDLSRRMKQFFDFYLNNGVEPTWMKTGIPATEKGKNFGF